MIFVGIDPGKSGGIAVIDEHSIVLHAVKMPETPADLLVFLGQFNPIKPGVESFAMLERVASAPGMGVVSAFTFGRGFGCLETALLAECIPFDLVVPTKWQAAMGVLAPKGQRGQLGKKDKNISKRRAQALFPRVTCTHAISDALLLAEYCRRVRRGERDVPTADRARRGGVRRRRVSRPTGPDGPVALAR